MSGSDHDANPKTLPVPWTARPEADIEHQRREWVSGTRGGGHVPKDFSWPTNPKKNQEENGSAVLTAPISK